MDRPSALTSTRPLGPPLRWSLDLAALGGLTCFLAPVAVGGGLAFPLMAGLVGAVTGAVLGPIMRALFLGPLQHARVLPLLAAGTVVGALWGGTVASLASLTMASFLFVPAMACGAVAGAVQLGWFWLPHLLRRGKDRSIWPVLLGAAVISPAVGYLSLVLGMALLG